MKPTRNGRDRGIWGTRRERAARVRRDLVHTAGECFRYRNCIVTSFFGDPKEALDLLRSGAVRIPQSLRARWREALSQ